LLIPSRRSSDLDMPEMLPDDKLVERLAGQTRTLAEFLLEQAPDGWEPPQVRQRALVQTHCHQHAAMGFDADLELMRRAGIDAERAEEHTSELQSRFDLVCRLLLEKKKKQNTNEKNTPKQVQKCTIVQQ